MGEEPGPQWCLSRAWDVDAAEATAVVASVPFARGVERVLGARLPECDGAPAARSLPASAANALEILAQGLAPCADRAFRE